MAAFGLGTIPLLFLAGMGAGVASPRLRGQVMKVAAVGELRVLRPKEIRITGGSTELACGLQQRKVRVGYIQATREVVSVEFLP